MTSNADYQRLFSRLSDTQLANLRTAVITRRNNDVATILSSFDLTTFDELVRMVAIVELIDAEVQRRDRSATT